jgi:hypothetical protein
MQVGGRNDEALAKVAFALALRPTWALLSLGSRGVLFEATPLSGAKTADVDTTKAVSATTTRAITGAC